MKAAIARWKRIVCDEIPEIAPGSGQVLVKTLACGICGSDLHALKFGEAVGQLIRSAGAENGLVSRLPRGVRPRVLCQLAVIMVIAGQASTAAAASAKTLEALEIESTINHCLSVVHHTRPSNSYLQSYFRSFDAFYNPATGQVKNNAFQNGYSQPEFVFDKCMAASGLPLK